MVTERLRGRDVAICRKIPVQVLRTVGVLYLRHANIIKLAELYLCLITFTSRLGITCSKYSVHSDHVVSRGRQREGSGWAVYY
jgi:hypothetical protein